MNNFRELYNADISRYGGSPEIYMRIFHFLYRKAATNTFAPMRLIYKAFFRIWANRRGLEISVNQHIGGGFILGMPIILQSMGKLLSGKIVIYIKEL